MVGSGTRGGNGSTWQFDSSVGGIVLSLGFVLLGVALRLITSAAGQGADGALDSARDRVDGSLEGGGVIVGRHLDDWVCGWFKVKVD